MKSRGFTLIELIIVVAIIGILASLTLSFCGNGCLISNSKVVNEAYKYAEALGLKAKGVSCTNRDTDNDGYVSCSISYQDGDKITILPIECSIRMMNDGCRAPKPVRRSFW